MWVGFKCNGLVNFFSERRYFKCNTCVFPPCPPPPPSSFISSPFQSPPPSSVVVVKQGHLWLWGSDRGVLSREGWPIKDDSCSWHIWWIRAMGEFGRSTGGRRWPTATHPPSTPAPLVSLVGDWRQRGGGGGGRSKAWVCTWSTYAQLVPESGLQHTQDLLDVTWTVSSFSIISCEFNEGNKGKSNVIIG